jgi:beta-glucosidase-like glycosyl hydrolase/CubicO group peptidase (beta-lactamase class C family)
VKLKSIVLLCLGLLIGGYLFANYSTKKRKTKKTTVAKKKKKKKHSTSAAKLDAVSYSTHIETNGDTIQWIEAQLKWMNDTQRIGQLFMMPAWQNKDSVNCRNLPELITKYNIGGVIMMQATPQRHANKLNYYQSLAKTPLLVGFDGEWGLGMRIDSTLSFPHQLTLGAIQNDSLIEQMGIAVGEECKRMGIHINFAPDVDINNNARNPVINDRSFGENADNVIRKGIAYMNGMHKGGILTCAKHFPGHGDTEVDSHADLPVLNFSRNRLDSLELKPFIALIQANVPSVMVAHLAIPQLEPDEKTPASLSQNIVEDLLKTELGYKGLVITDALGMNGVTKNFADGVVDVKALLAGNDMLLMSKNVPEAFNQIFKAIEKKLITQDEIDNRVRKILYYKYKAGLNHYQPIDMKNLQQDLQSKKHIELIKTLFSNAFTAITSTSIKESNTKSTVAIVNINGDSLSIFSKLLLKNANVKCFRINSTSSSDSSWNFLQDSLQNYSYTWFEIHKMSRFASKEYGLSWASRNFIKQISAKQNCGVILFGSPYATKYFDDCKKVVVAYEDNSFSQQALADLFLGKTKSKGKLPVTSSSNFTYKKGNELNSQIQLKENVSDEESVAELVGMNSKILKKIDSIALNGIQAKAYPGCQIVVLKDGKMIYDKTFGTPTYESKKPVKKTDLYDLASITKIASTTLACMKLYEEGKLDLNKTIADYLPEAKRTNKKKIIIKDLLLHQAGLVPFIPFYKDCMNKKGELDKNFSTEKDEDHTLAVAEGLWMSKDYLDKMWDKIYKSDIKTPGKYVYSDLDLYFMKRICESLLKNETTDEYVNRVFYQPMKLKSLCFNPLEHGFKKQQIMPTEEDNYFRHQLIWGYVHDQGAAMCGGIQGHAGLFGNAEDLAQLMLLLNDKGEYKGKRYLKKETVDYFTSKQSNVSRRGLGFDKQEPNPNVASPMCKSASVETFGHTGFTGTSTWVDPKYNLVFVFLSNRVYPEAENKKIITMGTRTAIQEVLYEAMKK